VIGVNDVLGRGFDPAAFERDRDHVVVVAPPGDLGRPAPAVARPPRDLIHQAELIGAA
jgi:hypothetical protein